MSYAQPGKKHYAQPSVQDQVCARMRSYREIVEDKVVQSPRTFRELEIVRLKEPFPSSSGMIPKGTEATVLQVFDSGVAYQVEFEGPHEEPETLPAGLLEADAT